MRRFYDYPLRSVQGQVAGQPEVKREYDALVPEFEALAKKLQARNRATSRAPNSRRIVESDRHLAPKS